MRDHTAIEAANVPKVGICSKDRKLFVKLKVDREIKKTTVSMRSSAPKWNEEFSL